ncbi:MAG TPA: class II aldolase/adducin family protein [Candidatus Nanoarchaeia archaeon]|nr:class II aldolase/adducin family protein [Candidatus Nanoarchaeia archaeon]
MQEPGTVAAAMINVGKLAYQQGLFRGTDGNISVREKRLYYVTESGANIGLMDEHQILLGFSESLLAASRKPCKDRPSKEFPVHMEFYDAGYGAVVHLHGLYAQHFAETNLRYNHPLAREPVYQIERTELGPVFVVDYCEPGTLVAKGLDLKTTRAVIVRGHGTFVAGRGEGINALDDAFAATQMIEGLVQLIMIREHDAKPIPPDRLVATLKKYDGRLLQPWR